MFHMFYQTLFEKGSITEFTLMQGLLFIKLKDLFVVFLNLLLTPFLGLINIISSFDFLQYFLKSLLFLLAMASALR